MAGVSPTVFNGWRDLPTFIYQQNESTGSKGTRTRMEEFGVTRERRQEEEGLDLVAGRALRL